MIILGICLLLTAIPAGAQTQEGPTKVSRAFVDRLAPHMPVYFLYGPQSPEIKYQLSVKYKLAGPEKGGGLQLAYSQRSLWDYGAPSSPFYDTSYMPEVFWESFSRSTATGRGPAWLGYQADYQHESNGRDGPQSRSMDAVFVRPLFRVVDWDGWEFMTAPRLFAYLPGTLSDNPDLPRYRGCAEWIAAIGKADGLALLFFARTGSRLDRGSLEANLTFPLRSARLGLESYVVVQWFEGYGESLLSYGRRSSALRGGIALVR